MSDTEKVLCIPAREFNERGFLDGWLPKDQATEVTELLTRNDLHQFVARGDCETDETLLQLIPYVIYACGEEFLTYTRGNAGGEKRLHVRRSLGFGGHMNEEDGGDYFTALIREQNEELILPSRMNAESRYPVVGFLRDISTDVGRVHVGVVHLAGVHPGEKDGIAVRPEEQKSLTDLRWETLDQMQAAGVSFEGWSQIMLHQLATVYGLRA